jgi:hypothetical protein
MFGLAHYRVYVEHPYGIDRLIVSLKNKRSVALAGAEGRNRVIRMRRTGDVKVLDVVPMKYVAGQLTETRKMRKQEGKFVNKRRPKARKTVRVHKKRVL